MKVKAKPEVHDHLLDEFDNQGLEPNKEYEVIGMSYDYYRVLDDYGEPILYPKYLFDVTDSAVPKTWTRKDYAEDEYYLDPPELSELGFYEDYFDGKSEARATFENFLISYGLKVEPNKTR